MTESQFIFTFLTKIEIQENVFSCFRIALNDARLLAGRNLDTGKINNNILSGNGYWLSPYSFIGIINYLLILDMIGTIFNKRDFETTKANSLFRSLKQFSNLSEGEINTIIALRNSLAHNYSLINIPINENEVGYKLHHFTLVNDRTQELITTSEKWSGNIGLKSDINSTKIGVNNLVDLIEDVVSALQREHRDNNIELRMSFLSLKGRFTVSH